MRTVPLPRKFKAWLDNAVHSVLPKDSLGEVVHYALKHWGTLTRFTEAGIWMPQTTTPSAA